ncbi:MAG: ROK family protein [Gemmataceae bacterium]|nr:ROK family protein [Gemmataceae bacterium]MCI0741395.1 ROK family protein [Gemmataceae bacterium]
MLLGIEIGGTKLQLGLGAVDGVLKGLWRGTVDAGQGADGIRKQIRKAVPDLLEKAGILKSDVRGVGIGFGGPVDDATRTVIKSHQIEGWDNFPLAQWIEDLLGSPAVLGNDADVAGLAEALIGAGKGFSPIFYITIGSGIGGGLIINGEIYRGCGRGAAEIGHLRIPWGYLESDRPLLPNYLAPILEDMASGWSIGKLARELASKGFDADSELFRLVFGQKDRITAAHVAKAAECGDVIALNAIEVASAYLANAVAQVIALVCPRRIVIGGGVALMGDRLLFEPLRIAVAQLVFQPFAGCYDIVPAALGEEVVVHGALALARKRLDS